MLSKKINAISSMGFVILVAILLTPYRTMTCVNLLLPASAPESIPSLVASSFADSDTYKKP